MPIHSRFVDLLQLGLLHHHHLIHQVCGSGRSARVQKARVTVWIRVAVMFRDEAIPGPPPAPGCLGRGLGDLVVQGWREDEPALGRNYFLGGGSFYNTRYSFYDVNLPVEYLVEVK